jgi:hypothetical protein
MSSTGQIAIQAVCRFASRAQMLSATIAVAYVALLPGTVLGQWSSGTGGVIYYNGGRVGIGTTSPLDLLTVVGPGGQLGTTNGYYVLGVFQDLTNYRGLSFGYDGTGQIGVIAAASGGGPSQLAFYTANNSGVWGERVRLSATGNLGVGTTAPQYPLSVNGTIQAKEVLVNTGWSDYVFRPDYRLKPLDEVAAYIRANHHLPEIPSETEIKENGVSLGEMQAKLLAKVEELTLHMIQADERNNRLERQNRQMQQRITRLEAR